MKSVELAEFTACLYYHTTVHIPNNPDGSADREGVGQVIWLFSQAHKIYLLISFWSSSVFCVDMLWWSGWSGVVFSESSGEMREGQPGISDAMEQKAHL